MPRTRPYPLEFRRQIIELARAGRSAWDLAQEFEPSYWTIKQWIKQADRDEGLTAEGLSTIPPNTWIGVGARHRDRAAATR